MEFTKRQKAAVKALVSVHETSKPVGDYGRVAVLSDGAGISYGAHQATHKSLTLYKVVKLYCSISNSPVSKALSGYLTLLSKTSKRFEAARDKKLLQLLRDAGKEQAMRYAQEKVFDANYFEPALAAIRGSGWRYALSLAVVYDSMIQGGWLAVRDRVKSNNEKQWITKYVSERRKWLSTRKNSIVRKTVYRMSTFERLIAKGNWDLTAPFQAHGVTINDNHLEYWESVAELTGVSSEIESQDLDKNDEFYPVYEGNTEGILDDDVENDIVEDIKVLEDSEIEATGDESGDPPKPGEPAPDVPASPGEPIVGGRPQDPQVPVEQIHADKPTGWKTWWTSVTGVLAGTGLSAASAISWFSGAIQDPTSGNFILALLVIGIALAALFGLGYLITRTVLLIKRERQAHELTLEQLRIKATPNLYNVGVKK